MALTPRPVLQNPKKFTTVPATINGSGGDVLITPNHVVTTGLTVSNCRNVIILGGTFRTPRLASGPTTNFGVGLITLKGITGTAHVEGCIVDPNNNFSDAIRIYSSKGANLVVQRCLIQRPGGRVEGPHGDLIHAQGDGPCGKVIIEETVGLMSYQGLQLTAGNGGGGTCGERRLEVRRCLWGIHPDRPADQKDLRLVYSGKSATDSYDWTPLDGTVYEDVFCDISLRKSANANITSFVNPPGALSGDKMTIAYNGGNRTSGSIKDFRIAPAAMKTLFDEVKAGAGAGYVRPGDEPVIPDEPEEPEEPPVVDVEVLAADVAALKSDVACAAEDCAANAGAIEGLQEALVELTDRCSAFEVFMSNMEARMAALEADVHPVTAEQFAELQAKVQYVDDRVDVLANEEPEVCAAEMRDAEDRIAFLEGRQPEVLAAEMRAVEDRVTALEDASPSDETLADRVSEVEVMVSQVDERVDVVVDVLRSSLVEAATPLNQRIERLSAVV